MSGVAARPGRSLALAGLCALTAGAQESPSNHPPAEPLPPRAAVSYETDTLPRLPGLFVEDLKGVVSAPARWDGSQWGGAALAGLTVVGTALLLDRTVDEAVVRNRRPGWDRLAKNVEQLGGTGGLVLMGAGYVTASLLGRDEARALWVDAGMATLLARGVITIPAKFLAGRSRPEDGLGSGHFRPFTSADSFPSGHAAQAFAMASVIALHADSPWVGGAAYGAATLVGLARIERRQHFTSDVLAGALVGTLTGRAVVGFNTRLRTRGSLAQCSLQPTWSPGFQGLTFQARF